MDHIVLSVRNVSRALKFYTDVLGLEAMGVEDFHAGKASFPSVRINNRTIIDLLPIPDGEPSQSITQNNMHHYCLTIEPTDMAEAIRALKKLGVTVMSKSPSKRAGARGVGTSFYIKDPEENTIELRHY